MKQKRTIHPLAGSSLSNYLKVIIVHFPKTFKGQIWCIIIGLAILLRSFHSFKEKRRYGKIIARMPLPEDPVFIIGHPRSGTTHLHNLLSQDTQFATVMMKHTALPWNFLDASSIWVRFVEKGLPEKRWYDQVDIKTYSPQEEEMALGNMGNICSYYAFYFATSSQKEFRRAVLLEGISDREREAFLQRYCYFLKKLMLDGNQNKRLLLKNPANTAARIRFLKNLFPKAKFIHIYRNPFNVFVSILHNVEKTLPNWALQSYDKAKNEPNILENYTLMYKRFFEEADHLAEEDLYQLTFEDLENDPVAEVKRIYEYLNINGFDQAKHSLETYCNSLKGYNKNNHFISQRQADLVKYKWAFTLKRWGYHFPQSLTIKN